MNEALSSLCLGYNVSFQQWVFSKCMTEMTLKYKRSCPKVVLLLCHIGQKFQKKLFLKISFEGDTL